MRALVTGAAGFLGSHLVDSLVGAGWEVVAVDDLSTGRTENLAGARREAERRSEYFRLIVTNVEHLHERYFDQADIVYHLAAVVGVDRVMAHPRLVLHDMHKATRNVIRWCELYHRRLIITSTSEVYGRSDEVPFHEDQDVHIGPPTDTRGTYALMKLLDEYVALESFRRTGLPVTIARLFNTVGPRQRHDFGMVLPRFVRQALAGEPLTIHGDGTQSRCFSHVKDVVRCLLLLSQVGAKLEGEIVNVGSAIPVSILELARQVLDVVGSTKSSIIHVPDRPSDMRRRAPSLEKLRRLVGFVPSTPLRSIIEHVRDQMR
jgi:UDP-glucose 4-epimerase